MLGQEHISVSLWATLCLAAEHEKKSIRDSTAKPRDIEPLLALDHSPDADPKRHNFGRAPAQSWPAWGPPWLSLCAGMGHRWSSPGSGPSLHQDPDGPICQSDVNSWAGHEQKVPPRLAGWVGPGGQAWCLAKARLTEGWWHGLHFGAAAWGNLNFAPIFLVHVWAHSAGPPKLEKKCKKNVPNNAIWNAT